MPPHSRPVLVAYDGSLEAQAAIRTAADVFAGRTLLIVSVWEPGLALVAASANPTWETYSPTFEYSEAVDRVQQDHAVAVADDGAAMATAAGATALAMPVRDAADVARTLAALADEHDVCAIIVGSRGRGGVRGRLFGSTSTKLLHDSLRPILVVRGAPLADSDDPAQ